MADPLEREQAVHEVTARSQKQACMNNLRAIEKAIAAYKSDHQGEVPDWLSDLYPKYLQDQQILLCPADKTRGSPARFAEYKDAKMPCSYLYEFNPMTSVKIFLFDFNPPKNLTFKESKRIQLKYFGGIVPIVICRHHGSPVINLGYNGEIYPSTGTWEYTPEAIRAAFSSFQSVMTRNPDGWEREISLDEIDEYARRCGRASELRVLLEI